MTSPAINNKPPARRDEGFSFAVPPYLFLHQTTVKEHLFQIRSQFHRDDTLDPDYGIPPSKPTQAIPFRFAAPESIQPRCQRRLTPSPTLCCFARGLLVSFPAFTILLIRSITTGQSFCQAKISLIFTAYAAYIDLIDNPIGHYRRFSTTKFF